jgi:hypothetical protein
VRVTVRGPGIAAVTADCAWATVAKVFQCASPYTITAYENPGPGFSAAPAVGSAVNPETLYFN